MKAWIEDSVDERTWLSRGLAAGDALSGWEPDGQNILDLIPTIGGEHTIHVNRGNVTHSLAFRVNRLHKSYAEAVAFSLDIQDLLHRGPRTGKIEIDDELVVKTYTLDGCLFNRVKPIVTGISTTTDYAFVFGKSTPSTVEKPPSSNLTGAWLAGAGDAAHWVYDGHPATKGSTLHTIYNPATRSFWNAWREGSGNAIYWDYENTTAKTGYQAIKVYNETTRSYWNAWLEGSGDAVHWVYQEITFL